MNMLEQIRAAIRANLDARNADQVELDTLVAGAEARSDGEGFTAEEETRFAELRTALVAADEARAGLEARETELAAAEEARAAAAALAQRIGAPTATEVRVTSEPDIYHRHGRHSFVVDLYRSQMLGGVGFPDSVERLQRHSAFMAEQRDASVASFGGLIPPQYLVDEFAPLARAGRPFSNSIRLLPLPADGTSFTIPRGTTGTSTDEQSSEGDAVSETDYDETDLTFALRTIAGAQDVSRQSLERGHNIDLIVFADLAADYAVKLNVKNITATLGTSGVESVTYTDASPTLPELHPKIADAVQRVNALRFMPATAIWMHPRRWGWMTAQVDSTGRPLVSTNAPQNPMGVGQAAAYGQVVGEMLGLPVITDASIPTNLGSGTNEDVIIVGRAPDAILWEEDGGAPKELRFEATQAKKLTVELVAYGYSAFTAGRYPKAFAKIGGTGLVTPTF